MNDGCPKTRDGWEGRYTDGNTPWDLGAAPPVLHNVIAAESRPLRVIVPGAGYGYDAVAWARAGHDVTMVDIAPSAVAGAKRLARTGELDLTILEGDIFELPEVLRGAFDLVWEHTCFCALDPLMGGAYADLCATWLARGGRMIALLWNHGMAGGPPYDITPELARSTFEPVFEIESVDPVVESAPGRSNEFLMRMTRIDPA